MVFGKIADFQLRWTKENLEENNLSEEGLFNEGVVLYGIFQGVVPVAMGGLEFNENTALLRSVCTKGDVKKTGLGKLVVQHILTEAKNQNLKTIYLLTDTAEEFFSKIGFVKTQRNTLPKAFEDKPLVQNVCTQNSACMQLELNNWAGEFRNVSVL